MSETHLIVGGGLAAGKAAEAMREEGFDGRIVLVTAEGERPYERPPLSKEYLRGEAGREKVYLHEDRFYEENEIDLRVRTSVAAIDAAAREAVLDSGERLAFDRLLLATGATPRTLSVPGHDLEGIHYLLAGINVDVWDVTEAIQEQIRSGVRTPAGASQET